MLDKFNNEADLLKSYVELEKEFTRKCQELSKLKKELEKSAVKEEEVHELQTDENLKEKENISNEEKIFEENLTETERIPHQIQTKFGESEENYIETEENSIQTEENNIKTEQNSMKTEEVCDKVNKNLEKPEEVESGSGFGLELRIKAGEFLRNNPEAKEYTKEISKLLLLKNELLKLENPFEVAYALVLKDNKKVEKREESPAERRVLQTLEKNTETPVQKRQVVNLLGRDVSGFVPSRVQKKYGSFDDARDELMRRFS